jgi:hypothetical protein
MDFTKKKQIYKQDLYVFVNPKKSFDDDDVVRFNTPKILKKKRSGSLVIRWSQV